MILYLWKYRIKRQSDILDYENMAWFQTLGIFVAAVIGLDQTFDVAAIKENHSGERVMLFQPLPGGRFTATNCSPALLIQYAFQVMRFQVAGAPDWVMADRFDVNAHKEGNPPASEMPKLVQRLLEDRFQLREHWESREAPVYLLTTIRAGNLQPAQHINCPTDAPCGSLMNSPGHAKGYLLTAADLAGSLSFFLQRTVIDETHLTGKYDIELQWTPDSSPDADLPSIATAIEEQLGLRLRSSRGTVRFLEVPVGSGLPACRRASARRSNTPPGRAAAAWKR